MDNELNTKRSANCSQQLEKTDEKEVVKESESAEVEEKIEVMECDEDIGEELDDPFGELDLDGGSSVSSSVLDSPKRSTEEGVPGIQRGSPGDPPGNNGNPLHSTRDSSGSSAPTSVEDNGKRRKPGKLKMTNAQRRRMDYFVRKRHSPKEARQLALVPVEEKYQNKR